MKTKSLSLALVIAAVGLFSSCKKDATPATQNGNVQSFFDQTQVSAQTLSANLSTYNTLTGAKGTIIKVAPGSLLHQNGTTVTGSVQFQLRELYSHGDMILSNAATVSNGSLLKSGGEIYLTATQGSENLLINHSNPLVLQFPTSNATTGMQLFTGSFSTATATTPATINWNPVANANATIVLDSSTLNQYFGFSSDSFGWTNCDQFYNLTGGTDLQVQLPVGFDSTNTRVFMLLDAENSLAWADVWASPIYKFHACSHTPIGINVTIIAIAQKGNQFYYAIQHETTASGVIFTVTMTPAPVAAIKTAIQAL
ncbi:MAG: hypothetical protein JWO06_76 [Bacteroidota bacterium]|nr:hypothetical protein [Bacteroidota bacterium]